MRVAKALHEIGVVKDDVVGIVVENRFEFVVIAFGTFLLNATLAPLNPNYSESTYTSLHVDFSKKLNF